MLRNICRRLLTTEVTSIRGDSINTMCVMPGSEPDASSAVLKESAGAHLQAAAMGARVFGAFLEGGEPVGRIEIMPIEAAPNSREALSWRRPCSA